MKQLLAKLAMCILPFTEGVSSRVYISIWPVDLFVGFSGLALGRQALQGHVDDNFHSHSLVAIGFSTSANHPKDWQFQDFELSEFDVWTVVVTYKSRDDF